jgi:acyl-CoA thioesterase YciA
MVEKTVEPKGKLILRTLAMPADTNSKGDIFGGWIMSQMDIAGGILSQEITNSRMVTVAVNSMKFIHPVLVGDVVGCYGSVVRIGNTSITLELEVWVHSVGRQVDGKSPSLKVTEAAFTYVAIDENGKKKSINKNPE